MTEILTARTQLLSNMRFNAESGSGHTLLLDAVEHHGEQNPGFHPMEMFLIGLAGCTGMEVLSLLREQGQQVTTYEITVIGKCAAGHPGVFTEIGVEHTLTGPQIQPGMVARALQLSAERSCGAMPGSVVPITHTYRIRYPSFGGGLIGCRHYWRQAASRKPRSTLREREPLQCTGHPYARGSTNCDADVREAGMPVLSL